MRWSSSYLPLNQSDDGIEHIELSPPLAHKRSFRKHSFRTFSILSVLLTVSLSLYYFDAFSFFSEATFSSSSSPQDAAEGIAPPPDIPSDLPSDALPEDVGLPLDPSQDTPPGWYFYNHPSTFKSPLIDTSAPRNYSLTRGQRVINHECADLWIARGKVCSSMAKQIASKAAAGDNGKIDVLWTWINGSDPLLTKMRQKAAAEDAALEEEELADDEEKVEEKGSGLAEHHFRDHDELRYSMRSVYQNVPRNLLRRLHLFTSSLPYNNTDPSASIQSRGRMGHIPTWLDLSRNAVETPPIKILHHWEAFKVTEGALSQYGFPPGDEGADMWRNEVLPTFDSLTIESQFPHIEEFKDTLLYLNDDYFITRPLNSGDFSTPLYGPVFRIQRSWTFGHIDNEGWYEYKYDMEGEAVTLELSNWYLNDRFGGRRRSYIKHVARSMDVNILHEVRTVWADVLATSGSVRFRARAPQIHIAFLQMYYHIEKHREALIYSFIMLRSDRDLDGNISPEEAHTILDELSGENEFDDKVIHVWKPYRSATERENLLAAGLEAPAETSYMFTSADGYPFVPKTDSDHEWAHFAHGQTKEMCTMELNACFLAGFGTRSVSTVDLFQKWMFSEPRCADCAILALLKRSGKSGLSAFLPRHNEKSEDNAKVDALMTDYDIVGGSSSRWWEADFTPPAAALKNPRAFAIRNIQRYSFVIGDTPMEWLQVKDTSVSKKLETLKNPNGKCALLAINDDVKDGAEMEPTDRLLKDWYNVRWKGVVGWWERPQKGRRQNEELETNVAHRRHRRFGRPDKS